MRRKTPKQLNHEQRTNPPPKKKINQTHKWKQNNNPHPQQHHSNGVLCSSLIVRLCTEVFCLLLIPVLSDFSSSGDFPCWQVRVMGSNSYIFCCSSIVYATAEYHDPSTVIVHYHAVQKCWNSAQSVCYTHCAEQWNCFPAVFL